MAIQKDKTLNVIRGKNIVSKASKEDVLKLFEHIDALETFLDEGDHDDRNGTEGWRHAVGLD